MLSLLRLLFMLAGGALLLSVALSAGTLWYMNMLNARGISEALDFMRHNPPVEVWRILRYELEDQDYSTNPAYGRELVPGRGHAPWVMRINLDGRPRVIAFALAPQVWAAYDTESASLYQVWQGQVEFDGVMYNYTHGPQPVSQGAWYLRNEQPLRWMLEQDGTRYPASVRYLGHQYATDHGAAWINFSLHAGALAASITEQPEFTGAGQQGMFQRLVTVASAAADISVIAVAADGSEQTLAVGQNQFQVALSEAVDIAPAADLNQQNPDQELARGEAVILGGDCVGCHNTTDRVVGPSYARIAKRFRGYTQPNVVAALSHSVLHGSSGKWGQVAMPAHPHMDVADARAAVMYILSLADMESEQDIPVDAAGVEYNSTWDYQVGERLQQVHPAFALENLSPPGFEPKVGGLDFRSDGKLVLSSWDADGAVFLVDPQAAPASRVKRIGEGLQEPLGLKIVDDRVFVLQKQELTELIDHDGDERIDEYRAVSYAWPTSANFHSFAFGLEHADAHFLALLSICVQPGGASCPDQLPSQGKLVRISPTDGTVEYTASGFRTPNGIGMGPQGALLVTDNQGDYLPASKLLHVQPGNFYGSRAVPDVGVMQAVATPPLVWLPQNEIGNSPTQPIVLEEGPYAGQVIFGDVYHGGIKRVFMQQVNNAWQGAALRFSGGFQGGVNRIVRGPDRALYLGEIGNPPNWGEVGKQWHGLQRLSYTGNSAFELLAVAATSNGFRLTLTEPLAEEINLQPADLTARQWFYYPTEQYGGPKYDHTELSAAQLSLSADRRQIDAKVPGLKPGYVVYLALDRRLRSAGGAELWANEAWYTLNAIPTTQQEQRVDATEPRVHNTLTAAEQAAGWELMFDGESFGHWRNYGSTGPVQKWVLESGTLKLEPEKIATWMNWIFGSASGDLIFARRKYRDFELSLEWKISENGNSGIFYLVADEAQKTPWLTGLEMQVLHNEGHSDGQIETHRAGDLYDLIAADPETVRPPGQWNRVLLRVHNSQVEHWLNGVKVVEFTHGDSHWDAMVANSKFKDMPDFGKSASGYIVLQDHGDRVWFRNLKIRQL